MHLHEARGYGREGHRLSLGLGSLLVPVYPRSYQPTGGGVRAGGVSVWVDCWVAGEAMVEGGKFMLGGLFAALFFGSPAERYDTFWRETRTMRLATLSEAEIDDALPPAA